MGWVLPSPSFLLTPKCRIAALQHRLVGPSTKARPPICCGFQPSVARNPAVNRPQVRMDALRMVWLPRLADCPMATPTQVFLGGPLPPASAWGLQPPQ